MLRACGVRTVEPLTVHAHGPDSPDHAPPPSGGVAMARGGSGSSSGSSPGRRAVQVESNVAQLRGRRGARTTQSQEMQAFREGPLYLHALAESLKHALRTARGWLGDPESVENPVALLSRTGTPRAGGRVPHPGRTLTPDQYGATTRSKCSCRPTTTAPATFAWWTAGAMRWRAPRRSIWKLSSLLAVGGSVLSTTQMDDFTTRGGGGCSFGLIQSERNLPRQGKRPFRA